MYTRTQNTRSRGKSESTSTVHKRGLSGSILSKISLLRSNSGGDKAVLHGGTDSDETRSGSGGAMGGVQQSIKQRKRKGSLRKTALLGKGRDRKGSDVKEKAKSPLSGPKLPEDTEIESPLSLQPPEVNPGLERDATTELRVRESRFACVTTTMAVVLKIEGLACFNPIKCTLCRTSVFCCVNLPALLYPPTPLQRMTRSKKLSPVFRSLLLGSRPRAAEIRTFRPRARCRIRSSTFYVTGIP